MNEKMLKGSIGKSILFFFFPILIGTFFQQLYNTIDAAVVGQFAGTEALSSVGGSSSVIINLVVGFFTGLSAGCTVLISQYLGAKDEKQLDLALHTTYAFGILGGMVLGALGFICSPLLLKLMNTPENLMKQSTLYVRIYFAGLVFVFIYNLGSAILRALGDSKRPLYYLMICTGINIVLDLLFVVTFQMNVLGVAVATLLSQAVSSLLITRHLMNQTPEAKLVLSQIKLDRNMIRKMLKIGLPSGIQSSTYSISNMVIQSAINLFGVTAVAGWTAESKVDVIFWMINGSFGIACATFVGQNYGARNLERVRKGIRTCMVMALSTAIVIMVFLLTMGKYMLYLFTTEADVIAMGAYMISLIVPGYFLFVFIEILSGALRAQGNTLIPTIINISGIVIFRCIWIGIFGHSGNMAMVIYCYPISWLICAIPIILYYFSFMKKQEKLFLGSGR